MAYPKPFLRIGKKLLVEKIIDAYLSEGIIPVVALNAFLFESEFQPLTDRLKDRCKLVKNENTSFGRSYSIKLGLENLTSEKCCFIHNVDNPEVDGELLRRMLSSLKKGTYVVPCCNDRSGHPLLLDYLIMDKLKSLPDTGWILHEELAPFRRIKVPAGNNNVILNLNTPADYADYIKVVKLKKSKVLCLS